MLLKTADRLWTRRHSDSLWNAAKLEIKEKLALHCQVYDINNPYMLSHNHWLWSFAIELKQQCVWDVSTRGQKENKNGRKTTSTVLIYKEMNSLVMYIKHRCPQNHFFTVQPLHHHEEDRRAVKDYRASKSLNGQQDHQEEAHNCW